MTRRIAIYGGSFDPPHHGHALAVTWCLCLRAPGESGAPRFDAIHVVPVFGHAFGKALTPFETRVAMVEDAVSHLGPRVVVDRIEATLSTTGPTYTVDMLRAIAARDGDVELTLVVGTDAWAERKKWRAWDEVERLVGNRFVVLGRAGFSDPPTEDGVTVDVHLPAMSSTEVRRRARSGEPWWWMVSEGVAAKIRADGLYR